MKKIIILMLLIFGSLSFSNEVLDKMIGIWYDEYGYILKIEKNKDKYYQTLKFLEGGFETSTQEDREKAPLVYKKREVKLINDKYIDVFGDNESYAFLNKKELNFINSKTKKVIFDNNFKVAYYMFKD